MEIKYIPKGSMCMVCTKLYLDCSNLCFDKYPPMGKPDEEGYVVVRCHEFNKKEKTNVKEN